MPLFQRFKVQQSFMLTRNNSQEWQSWGFWQLSEKHYGFFLVQEAVEACNLWSACNSFSPSPFLASEEVPLPVGIYLITNKNKMLSAGHLNQTVNIIFVKTTLLSAWQSNYSYTEKNNIFLLITLREIHETQLCSVKVVENGQVFSQQVAGFGHTAAKGRKAHKTQHRPNSQSLNMKWQWVFCPIDSCRVILIVQNYEH